jgi:hypothetical protein
MALPPEESTFHASAFAATPKSHVEITIGFVTRFDEFNKEAFA